MYVDTAVVGDTVHVSERLPNGSRHEATFPAPYELYVQDEHDGRFVGLRGERLRREVFRTRGQFNKKVRDLEGVPTWEADVRPELRILEREYAARPLPTLHVAFLDIEVDVSPEGGFPSYENAYGRINAFTVYRKWSGDAITVLLAPGDTGLPASHYDGLVSKLDNTFVVETEHDLLEAMLDSLDDADVVSGWNSERFDLPYVIARIRTTMGQEDPDGFVAEEEFSPAQASMKWLRRLCLFGKIPRKNSVERFGTDVTVFELCGRVHLDYFALYRKFTFIERHSYKLDHILQVEVGESKVAYEGPVWDFYRNHFETFARYNRQDVMGIVALDKKLGFIDLANGMAHMACVQLHHVLGSVVLIGQALLMEIHADGRISPTGIRAPDTGPVPGAFVHVPRGGMFEWVASYDINSLYPTMIRVLNIGPDTLVGQLRTPKTDARVAENSKKAKPKQYKAGDVARPRGGGVHNSEAWAGIEGADEYHDVMKGDAEEQLTMDYVDGTSETRTGVAWREWLHANNVCMSANGTVFDLSHEGFMPRCVARWFRERLEMQGKARELHARAMEMSVRVPSGMDDVSVDDDDDA